MVADHPERFDRVVMGNTGLPLNTELDQAIVDKVLASYRWPSTSLPSMVRDLPTPGAGGDPEAYPFGFAHWQSSAGTHRTCRLGF